MEARPFLHDLAYYLKGTFGNDLREVAVVLPNRRGALFLKKYLAEVYQQTIWLPEILSIEEYVQQLAGLNFLDNTDLLFESYETYKKVYQDPDSFEDYVKWAPSLLADFNEIDKSLADSRALFTYLNDTKALELWSPANRSNDFQLTDFQRNYLKFWNSLNEFYHRFTESLINNGFVYQGLAFRYVNEKFDQLEKNISYKKLVFAGFNAFNIAEEQFVRKLVKAGKAHIVWDADKYYLEDENQEAGRFLRKYFKDEFLSKAVNQSNKNSESILWINDFLSNQSKEINLIGISKSIGQAKYAGKLVEEFAEGEDQLQKTAIVLADENLLLPMLHSLPPGIDKVNITMGYSLRNSVVYDLINKLISLFSNREKFGNSDAFYYSDVLNLVRHPLIKQGMNAAGIKQTEVFTNGIVKTNRVWIGEQELLGFCEEVQLLGLLKNCITDYKNGIKQFANNLASFVRSLLQALKEQTEIDTVNAEFIWAALKVLNRLSALNEKYGSVNSIESLLNIFHSIAQNSSVAFIGEPLRGLQLMGMLETRTLDFENVILLSANEDILPTGKSSNSFIPFDVKREFKITTTSDKDAIFAYHFYRLLQRAKKVYLLYNTEPGDLGGSGERSRYITQIQNELLKKNKAIKWKESLLQLSVSGNSPDQSIVIEKNEEVRDNLNKLAEYGFSPSALNVYRSCGLKFYFQYIQGLREYEEVEETIDAAVFGSVLHEVLEGHYKQCIDKPLSVEQIGQWYRTAEQDILSALKKYFNAYDLSYGKNFLTIKVAVKYLQKFLMFEKENIEKGQNITIRSVEEELKVPYDLDGKDIFLKGKVDRIDQCNGQIRIIDYKTGYVEPKELKLKSVEDLLEEENSHDKSFQLLAYAYMYHKKNKVSGFKSGILSFRSLNNGLMQFELNKNENIDKETLDSFEEYLNRLFSEIFNKQLPFLQTNNMDTCAMCDFRNICNR